MNWVSRQGREEEVLPLLKLDNDQLFILSFAQVSDCRVKHLRRIRVTCFRLIVTSLSTC